MRNPDMQIKQQDTNNLKISVIQHNHDDVFVITMITQLPINSDQNICDAWTHFYLIKGVRLLVRRPVSQKAHQSEGPLVRSLPKALQSDNYLIDIISFVDNPMTIFFTCTPSTFMGVEL